MDACLEDQQDLRLCQSPVQHIEHAETQLRNSEKPGSWWESVVKVEGWMRRADLEFEHTSTQLVDRAVPLIVTLPVLLLLLLELIAELLVAAAPRSPDLALGQRPSSTEDAELGCVLLSCTLSARMALLPLEGQPLRCGPAPGPRRNGPFSPPDMLSSPPGGR